MLARTRQGFIAILLSVGFVLFLSLEQLQACGGNGNQHSRSQQSAFTPTSFQSASRIPYSLGQNTLTNTSPYSLGQQTALLNAVNQTDTLLNQVQQNTSSSMQNAVQSISQQQTGLQTFLKTAMQRQNGRLTPTQIRTLGQRETVIQKRLLLMQSNSGK
jgi:hypothetical protein